MRLNTLRLSNFRQHVDTTIQFDSGLTGVIGQNGSGKTTLLEAIAWALYGTPAARGSRDSIRTQRAGPRAAVKVELDFELGAHRYRVVRGLTSAELYLDNAAAPIANSISGVSDLLRRRLGMTHQEFFNTYFTGQKELAVMAAMGPTDRGQFLSRVLGYERLRTAQGLIRDQRKLIIAESVGIRQAMSDPAVVAALVADADARLRVAQSRARETAEGRAAARKTVEDLTPRWEAAQRERESLQSAISELRVAEAEESSLARDETRIAADLSDVAAAREELERVRTEIQPLIALRAELAEVERLAREDGRRRAQIENERALGEELARLQERKVQLESAPPMESEVRDELDRRRLELGESDTRLETARGEWIRDRQEAETKIEELKRQLHELRDQREQIVTLGEDGICPTCAQPLRGHYRNVLELIDEQTETVTQNGKYYRARIEQLKQMPPEVLQLEEARASLFEAVGKLERKFARVQAGIQELAALVPDFEAKQQRLDTIRAELAAWSTGYDAERHAAIRREVERLIPLEARAQRLGAAVDRQPQLALEREEAATRLTIARARVAELVARRDALQHAEAGFTEIRTAFESAAATFRAAEMTAITAEAELSGARAAADSAAGAQRELARAQEQLDTLNRGKRLHDELDRSYTDMRTDLNQQLRPEISEIASRYLNDLTDGRYAELELDESYNITVLEEGIPKPVISGGEEDLANLVLRLAISQMIAERAGQPFSLLILDEVFGSLDESRRHNVVDLLRRLHDRFEQVIVITHIDSVREGMDRVITVRYDEETGSSRVEQEIVAPVLPEELDLRAGAA